MIDVRLSNESRLREPAGLPYPWMSCSPTVTRDEDADALRARCLGCRLLVVSRQTSKGVTNPVQILEPRIAICGNLAYPRDMNVLSIKLPGDLFLRLDREARRRNPPDPSAGSSRTGSYLGL